jgi:hypothetical protein
MIVFLIRRNVLYRVIPGLVPGIQSCLADAMHISNTCGTPPRFNTLALWAHRAEQVRA